MIDVLALSGLSLSRSMGRAMIEENGTGVGGNTLLEQEAREVECRRTE